MASCDKVLLATMKLGNEILLVNIIMSQYLKNSSDAELIIKLVSSSVGERIFRDLKSESNIPSEEKTSADGENGNCFKVLSQRILLTLIFLNTL